VQLRSGSLRPALATLDEGARHAEHAFSPSTRAISMVLRANALFWRGGPGDPDEVLALADRAAEIADGPSTAWAVQVRCHHAEVVLLTGDAARSRWLLLDAAGGTELPRLTAWRRARWCDTLAQVALAEGDLRSAEHWARLAEASVKELPSAGRGGFAARSRLRAQALRGDVEGAVQSARRAVEGFSAGGERLENCRTLVAAATLSLDVGRTIDVDGWLSRAAFLAQTCGSGRLLGEIATESGRLAAQAARGTAAGAPAALSAREREIADLVRRGMSSRDIAGALFLSVRTVDSHLGRMYRKLGVSNRAELTHALLNLDSDQVQ
jgi:DNA-binding CsgD family transcriptional regulator